MNKIRRLIIMASFLLTGIVAFFFSMKSQENSYRKKGMRYGKQIIEVLDNYLSINGKVPNTFFEIDYTPDEYWGYNATKIHGIKFYYEKLTDSSYEIWFDISVGDSMYYRSDSRMWSINP